jgi:hypothetical protein
MVSLVVERDKGAAFCPPTTYTANFRQEGGETMEKKEFIPIDYSIIHYHRKGSGRQWCISPSCKRKKEGK